MLIRTALLTHLEFVLSWPALRGWIHAHGGLLSSPQLPKADFLQQCGERFAMVFEGAEDITIRNYPGK